MEQLKAFIEKVESDNELKAKIEALDEKAEQPDEIIVLAAKYGFTVTAEDIEQLKSNTATKNSGGELTGEQLENIAGGGTSAGKKYVCWFRPTGKLKITDSNTWLECDHDCWLFMGGYCSCHGKDHCIGKYHRIEEDGILAPRTDRNHKDKDPDNNYRAPRS